MKYLYNENYKTLLKEIKEDVNKWKHIPPVHGLEDLSLFKKVSTTQSNLQIQCNACQNPDNFFAGTEIEKKS